MINYKVLVVSIIITSYVIQIGNLILDKTNYSKLFKVVAGIILIMSILACLTDIKLVKYTPSVNSKTNKYSSESIKTEFENNLKKKIIDDLHNNNYVNIDLDVKTDFKTLKIYLYDNEIDRAEDIKKYIETKYCTPNDEVIITNATNVNY